MRDACFIRPQTMIVGKALDLLADHFRVSSDSTVRDIVARSAGAHFAYSVPKPLKLVKHDTATSEPVELANGESLDSQVEDGSSLLVRIVVETNAGVPAPL